MKDRANITIAISISIARFDLKAKGQGHVHFDCKQLKSGDRNGQHYLLQSNGSSIKAFD